ncbi:MAG: hypothetical protein HQK55_08855 [Deltaproteobacteria bacterium]|nr:hypothetical protein [Deltaproteobacteria bacterium]
MKNRHVGLVILSMPGSGASIITHILAELGCEPGGPLLPIAGDGLNGFGEHAEIVAVHEDFLRMIDQDWSDPRLLLPENFEGAPAESARGRLLKIYQRDFERAPLWMIKDPRLCRLLPLWREIFTDQNLFVGFVHVFSHPLVAARALAARHGFSFEKSLLLWLRYTLEAERSTRGKTRLWLNLEDLANDPVEILTAILKENGLDQVLSVERLASVVRKVLNSGESFYNPPQADVAINSALVAFINRLMHDLKSLAGKNSGGAMQELDKISQELTLMDGLMFPNPQSGDKDFNSGNTQRFQRELEAQRQDIHEIKAEIQKWTALLGKSLEVITHLERRLFEKETELAGKEEIISAIKAEKNSMEAGFLQSNSWKVTKPLRVITGIFKKKMRLTAE